MNTPVNSTTITSAKLALDAALHLITNKLDKNAIQSYYGNLPVYTETVLDLASAFLEVPTGWTRIARVRLHSCDDKGKVEEILSMAKRLGLDAHVRTANNGLTRREDYGRDSSSGLWDFPLEQLPGYEEWQQIEIDKYVGEHNPNSGPSTASDKRQAVYVALITLELALKLALARRYEYWKSCSAKVDILRAVPANGPGLNEIKALVGDLDAFTGLVAEFLAEHKRGHYKNLLKLRLTAPSFETPEAATRESSLSDEAKEIVRIGRLLGFKVYVRMNNNGRTWREGYGRCEGSWDYPLNKWPDYLEWVELEIDA